MHEFFISLVHPTHPTYTTSIGAPWLAMKHVRVAYRQQLEVTQQVLKLHVALLESLMEQSYLCNMICLSNNNLQLLTGVAVYGIGSYAMMSMCDDIGEKLQVISNMDRRVEKLCWNTALIPTPLFKYKL
jgi:hypothetical protein